MTLEEYLNKLSELNQFIEGIQSPSIEVRIFDFLLTVLGFVCGLLLFVLVLMVISSVILGICYLVGIVKKFGDDYSGYGATAVGFVATVGLFWMMIHGASKLTPFDEARYNKELNAKFEQTTRTVYNQLIEMDEGEFNQLVQANKSYALSKEQYREYDVVRQLIRDASKNRKD